MGVITKEELISAVEGVKKIQEEIRQFVPIAKEDLEHLTDNEFKAQVCYGNINNKVREAKEGDFLYQCSFHNRRYFDAKNRPMLRQGKDCGKTPKEKPGIDVNVAGLAKFVIDCPRAGEFMCKLKDFAFESKEKDVKNF